MREIKMYIDKELADTAEVILEDMGMSFDTLMTMSLKKLVKEDGVSFLRSNNSTVSANTEKMHAIKSKGFSLFRKDGGISKNNIHSVKSQPISVQMSDLEVEKASMTKSKALALFKNAGIQFNRNTTFSSKNTGSDKYWANPNFDVLEQNWNLILNDWIKHELHLFVIPAGTFSAKDLTARGDQQNKIDIQIYYDDSTFTDSRSKLSFLPYLVKTIRY